MVSELQSLHGLNKPKQGDSSSERLLVEKRKGERPMTAPFFIKFVHPALLSKGKNGSLGTLLTTHRNAQRLECQKLRL